MEPNPAPATQEPAPQLGPPWQHRLETAFERALSKWQLHLLALTTLGFVLGWALYGVSPLHSLKEISRKQEEDRLRGRMVRRHLDLAGDFLNVDQWRAAQAEFEQALRLDPIRSEAQLGLFKTQVLETLVERKEYDPEIVEKRLNLLLLERQDDPHALTMMGVLYRRIDRERALSFHRRAVQVEPRLAGAYAGMGEIYEEQGRPALSLEMYEKALALSKWNRNYLGNVIDHYQQRGDRQKDAALARADYQQVTERGDLLLRLDPTLLSTYIIVVQAHLRLGDLAQASKVQEQMLRYSARPEVWELKQNQGGWFWNTGARLITLPSKPLKLAYLRYQAAITEHLLGHAEAAAAQVKLAGGLDAQDLANVQHLLRWSSKALAARQPRLAEALATFETTYL